MNERKIPKKIFQTWRTKQVSPEFQNIINSWKIYNPDYEYYLYDDNDCLKFLQENFGFSSWVVNIYNKLKSGAFKTDLWRYCVLYIYGGFYIDIDTLCLGKIDNVLYNDTEFVVPIDLTHATTNHHLFNAFIGCIPKSKIMLKCIDRFIYNFKNNIFGKELLDFCGPGLLGRQVNIYLNLPETTSFLNKEGNKNKIFLLKFENLTEIIKDNVGNNLFQNKNGNVKIQKLYQLEMNKIPNYMTYDVEWNNMNSHSQTSSLNYSHSQTSSLNYPHSSTLYPYVTHAKKNIKSNKITQYTINNNNNKNKKPLLFI